VLKNKEDMINSLTDEESGASTPKTAKWIISLLLALYFMAFIGKILKNSDVYQWDFRAHYYAAEMHEKGLNFYDRTHLWKIAKIPVEQYYCYPPLAIWFYRIFSLFDFPTAYNIFLFMKCIMLAGLLLLWQKEFLQKKAGLVFLAFVLFAFNGALFTDFLAGNISLVEQCGLWLAFFFFLRKKYPAFCVMILLTSMLKVVPLFFLILLPLSGAKKKYAYFLGSAACWVSIQAASYFTNPMLFQGFLGYFRGIANLEWRGITNPATYVFIHDVLKVWGEAKDFMPAAFLLPSIFALVAIVVCAVSWKAYRRLQRVPENRRNLLMIFLVCMVFALLVPRFKDYSYLLLLVPAYYCLMHLSSDKGGVFLFVLMILTIPGHANPPGMEAVSRFLWQFYPLAMAYLTWILILRRIHEESDRIPINT